MTTDPIADMLTRIRNAGKAEHATVTIPGSVQKVELARLLAQEGYIEGYEVESEGNKKKLIVTLKFGPDRSQTISGIKRVSRPGNRVFVRSTNLPRVLGGLGTAIISTSSGMMTDRQAARARVGGEVVAYVW